MTVEEQQILPLRQKNKYIIRQCCGKYVGNTPFLDAYEFPPPQTILLPRRIKTFRIAVAHLLDLHFGIALRPYRGIQIPIQYVIMLAGSHPDFLVIFPPTGIYTYAFARRKWYFVKRQKMGAGIIRQGVFAIDHLKKNVITKIAFFSGNQYQILPFVIPGMINTDIFNGT